MVSMITVVSKVLQGLGKVADGFQPAAKFQTMTGLQFLHPMCDFHPELSKFVNFVLEKKESL